MTDAVINVAYASWLLLGQMAPYLLFGFLMAGVLSVAVSPEFVERHLGGSGFRPVLKAALLGVPLPLCSCGVIPVAAGFRRHGASRAATAAFLLSTPQTGIDSIVVTYALLGATLAVYRPVVALATGLLGGLLVMLFAQSNRNGAGDEEDRKPCTESCCADKESGNAPWRAIRYGFIALPRDIGPALLVGVLIGGAIATFVMPNQWRPLLGGGLLSIVLMMALGIPLYVCASASVPIAVGFIHAGASPGAALAFLIAGPATNAATITTIWKLLGVRSTLLFLLAIAISAVGGGLLFDWTFPIAQVSMSETLEHCHGMAGIPWQSSAWAVAILAVFAFAYFSQYGVSTTHEHKMATGVFDSPEHIELLIVGMTCPHCVANVARAIRPCPGVADVQIDLAEGRATVAGAGLDAGELAAAVQSAGYRATVVAKPASNG